MGFLHVLFAITLTFAFVRAGPILTLVHRWARRVFIVDMPVSFLFRWPAILMILAALLVAFPRSGVSLLMLPREKLESHHLLFVNTYVRSQGLLNTLSQSWHCCTSFTAACADLRRRAIERRGSSSASGSIERFAPTGLLTESIRAPVRKEMVCPSLILTSSAG